MVKKPYSCVKFEEAIRDIEYAFSFNPVFQYEECIVATRLVNVVNTLTKNLYNVLGNSCKYKLNIEISSQGRIHGHGTIIINNIVDFYLKLPKLQVIGTYCIKIIDNKDEWTKYCVKSVKQFEIPYTVSSMRSLPDAPIFWLEDIKKIK